MDKTEATAKANKMNKSAIMPFCPLINGQCQKGCVCWQEASPVEYTGVLTGKEGYNVTLIGCFNQMFFRECQHQY